MFCFASINAMDTLPHILPVYLITSSLAITISANWSCTWREWKYNIFCSCYHRWQGILFHFTSSDEILVVVVVLSMSLWCWVVVVTDDVHVFHLLRSSKILPESYMYIENNACLIQKFTLRNDKCTTIKEIVYCYCA